LFCAIHVALETIKQHLRILILKQYNIIIQAIFLKIYAKTLEHPDSVQCWEQGTTPDWGEGKGGGGGLG